MHSLILPIKDIFFITVKLQLYLASILKSISILYPAYEDEHEGKKN